MAAKRTAHYVCSTHWDREWYQSFQEYRFRLVRLLDEVMDRLKNDPDFRYFQMDGQSIPVEDYLEVHPEREADIRDLIESGQLRLGPWYVLPDEFLVSGESIIRNFQMGLDLASQFGRPSRVGFMCDMFGHTSQMPQILRGFNIDNALIWRGVNHEPKNGVFRWQSPDGSEVIAYRFSPAHGYCTYAFKVRKSHEPDTPIELDQALEGLKEEIAFEAERLPTDSILLFDGGDHLEIEPKTAEILKRANQQITGFEFIHSHLDGFIEDLREQRDRIELVKVGELREPAKVGDEQWLIPGVLSSRIHLKQYNARCENELCLWAEPFSTFAEHLGLEYPHGYLTVAWKHLLQNHPHDSICACSIDQVHKDMIYRFDQAHAIARLMADNAMRHIADTIKLPDLDEQDMAVVAFNPASNPVRGPVDLTLRFPADLDATFQEFFGFEQKNAFRLFDAEGRELPYQYVHQRRNQTGFTRRLRKFPQPVKYHAIDITTELDIPPCGYTTLTCKPDRKQPTRYPGSLAVNDHTIENAHLRVSVNCNGTLNITDKNSGHTFDRLLTIENRADIGDGWYHGVAVNDEIYSSRASSADVALIADGIAKATLKIRVTLQVPEAFDFDRMVRSEQIRPLVITHEVTLRKAARDVEVKTVVDNHLRDHRLRVLLPSEAKAKTYLADAAFDVIERPIALRDDNATLKELEVETKPQMSWTAVHDKKRGLAVVSTGLPESAVCDVADRPIALTLLRSFIKAVFTGGNEGGEIPGRHEFHYRIVPLDGPPDAAALTRMGQALACGIRTIQMDQADVHRMTGREKRERNQPLSRGFLELDNPDLVISAIKHGRKSAYMTVRLWNPTGSDAKAKLTVDQQFKNAHLSDLEGAAGDKLPMSGSTTDLTVKARQIVTVQFTK